MISKQINTSAFPQHIFWSYKPGASLDEDIVIERVILFGDLHDHKKLLNLVSKESLSKVVGDLEKSGRNKKRINFVKKILL